MTSAMMERISPMMPRQPRIPSTMAAVAPGNSCRVVTSSLGGDHVAGVGANAGLPVLLQRGHTILPAAFLLGVTSNLQKGHCTTVAPGRGPATGPKALATALPTSRGRRLVHRCLPTTC